jgi:hypothetical protein
VEEKSHLLVSGEFPVCRFSQGRTKGAAFLLRQCPPKSDPAVAGERYNRDTERDYASPQEGQPPCGAPDSTKVSSQIS